MRVALGGRNTGRIVEHCLDVQERQKSVYVEDIAGKQIGH